MHKNRAITNAKVIRTRPVIALLYKTKFLINFSSNNQVNNFS